VGAPGPRTAAGVLRRSHLASPDGAFGRARVDHPLAEHQRPQPRFAFNSLRARFPTWEAVRDAPVEDVVDAIRIAGLANQKGPRMQQVLREITAERGELDIEFLRDLPVEEVRTWLLRFNGVGPKTAAIVLQFSLGKPAFPVDTHVYRVTGRLGLRPEKMNAEQAHTWFEDVFSPEVYGPGSYEYHPPGP
jgi:endonuclease III